MEKDIKEKEPNRNMLIRFKTADELNEIRNLAKGNFQSPPQFIRMLLADYKAKRNLISK